MLKLLAPAANKTSKARFIKLPLRYFASNSLRDAVGAQLVRFLCISHNYLQTISSAKSLRNLGSTVWGHTVESRGTSLGKTFWFIHFTKFCTQIVRSLWEKTTVYTRVVRIPFAHKFVTFLSVAGEFSPLPTGPTTMSTQMNSYINNSNRSDL